MMLKLNLLTVFALIGVGFTKANTPFHNPNCAEGRVTIVHLFEWKWTDIAAECERFLGPNNFCGVQISPPGEHAIIMDPFRPWWEHYQPVSYKLHSRCGNEEEFRDMVTRCNDVGVRIFPDIVLNHFAEIFREGYGTGGTYYEAGNGYFPGIPYTMENFHSCDQCGPDCWYRDMQDWNDVRTCRFGWLIDVNQTNPDSLQKQADFLNSMIDIGVAGFRVDAAIFVSRQNFRDINDKLNDLNTEWFEPGTKPFMVYEVIDSGERGTIRAANYTELARVTEFFWGTRLKTAVAEDLNLIKDIYDPSVGMILPQDALVFVDNHDNQRGHGLDNDVLTYKTPKEYKIATAITLGTASEYGHPRIMSSYFFDDEANDEGPPINEDMTTKDVIINEDGTCGNGWVCEHRWPAITGMVRFSALTENVPLGNQWYSEDGTAMSFSRGDEGFVVVATKTPLEVTLYTALPPGRYVNFVIPCEEDCETVEVDEDGFADISLTTDEDPIIALHTSARHD